MPHRAIPAKPTLLPTLGAALLLAASQAVQAEEFHLRDGTKIEGTIIGYDQEQDAFRVETSFGLAIIFKDRILHIMVAEEEEPENEEKQAKTPEENKDTEAVRAPLEPPEEKETPATPPTAAAPTVVPATSPAPANPAPVTPPKEILEHTSGTRYVNETYGFHMFKPPTWRSYPELVRPGQNPLVAALGTPDEKTLMLIGRERYPGSLEEYASLAERALKRTYRDYRAEGEQAADVAGQPALQRDFTGWAEGRFWTGLALYFRRGQDYYTILAVTAARETVSFKQALLRKVINTLTFYD